MAPALALDGHHKLSLRPYQTETLAKSAEAEARGIRRQLWVLPTGTGKTVCFVALAAKRGDRTLIIAHRDELIGQAAAKARQWWPDADIGIVKAERNDVGAQDIIVASVQSLSPGRLAKMGAFGLVICDEAHHCTSTSWTRVLTSLRAGEVDGPLLVGVTATPDRSDGKGLSSHFDEIVVSYDILWAIRAGYLTDIRCKEVKLANLRLEDVTVRHGDYADGALGQAMADAEAPWHIVKAWKELASDRLTATYHPTIAAAQSQAAEFMAQGVPAACVSGVALDDRRRILQSLETGRIKVVTNAAVLCLDEQTEILTDRGWVGPDAMTFSHRVANWDDGRVFFAEPRDIVVRDRGKDEAMFTLETRQRSIRVTGGHRMLYRTLKRGRWLKTAVDELAGRCVELPICGEADPFPVEPHQEPLPYPSRGRAIAQISYNLRHLEGYGWDDSKVEAARRLQHRLSLSRTAPRKLTLDECRFIGFWLGDGSVAKLRRGGLEYTASQSHAYPAIIEWFDQLISRMGIHTVRREKLYQFPHVRWSFPRGTGGGSQQRVGLYSLEPYLDKTGSPWLWGLDADQFAALLEGLWYADGDHGAGAAGVAASMQIRGTQLPMYERLQSIAVVRGWSASIHRCPAPTNPNHSQQHTLSLRRQGSHYIGGLNPANRIQREDAPWHFERVWCVKTETRNIITRRRGTVTVMGNTEGWDFPALSCIIQASPTKSRGRYVQIVGRALRPYPGKEDALIIDVTGSSERMDLCSVPSLFGVEKKKMVRQARTVTEAIDEQAREKEMAKPRGPRTTGDVVTRDVDLFAQHGVKPGRVAWAQTRGGAFATSAGKMSVVMEPMAEGWRVVTISEKGERKLLVEGVPLSLAQGIADDHVRKHAPRALSDRLAPWRKKPPTDKQLALAQKLGIGVRPEWSSGDVAAALDARFAEIRLRKARK